MSGEKKIVGLWRETATETDQKAEPPGFVSGANASEVRPEPAVAAETDAAGETGWLIFSNSVRFDLTPPKKCYGPAMTGEKKIVGLWRETATKTDQKADPKGFASGADAGEVRPEPAVAAEADAAGETGWLAAPVETDEKNEYPEISSVAVSPSGRERIIPSLLILCAVAWLAFAAYSASDAFTRSPSLAQWPSLLAMAATPLALLCLLWIMFLRSGTSEQHRFARLAANLRSENHALNQSMYAAGLQLADAQKQLAGQARLLEQLGQDTVTRLQDSSAKIAHDAEMVAKAQADLSQSGDIALQRMEGLLAGLPKIDAVAQRLSDNFREAGLVAHQQGASLEAKLATLAEEAGRTTEQTSASVSTLKTLLEDIGVQTNHTESSIVSASGNIASTHEASLEKLTQLAQSARDRMTSTVEQVRRQMGDVFEQFSDKVGAAADQMDVRFAAVTTTSASIASSLSEHGIASDDLAARISNHVQEIERQLTDLDNNVTTRTKTIGRALDDTRAQLGSFGEQVIIGNDGAQKLVAHAESLLLALDSVTREMEETLPQALNRLSEQSGATQNIVAQMRPVLDASEMVAQSTLSHVNEVHAKLADYQSKLSEQSDKQHAVVGKVNLALADADIAMQKLTVGADHFSAESGARMVATLQQVRGTAEEAAGQAREALEAVIASASATMKDKAAEAISSTFQTEIIAQMAAVETASERAVSAANDAAERLMRQLITIMDTSASVEARVTEADQAIAATDRDSMAKQVGLLTESLKSTAIDLTKMLSHEVSDTAWEAYLKGDRGVFSRRAVKLIENSEAKELLRIYHNDDAYRETVNQFIHDFEAMLRVLMAARDGSAISVTLLSSDIGKLYVVLAQSIDRLRN